MYYLSQTFIFVFKDCNPGYYRNDTASCQPCEKGAIKTTEGDKPDGCEPCAENTTTLGMASSEQSDCGELSTVIFNRELWTLEDTKSHGEYLG